MAVHSNLRSMRRALPVPASTKPLSYPMLRAMEGRARPVAKAERHRLEGSLITRKRIGTQLELLAALAAAGVRVTQATVSRDIRELGLEKTEDELGRQRYVLPAAA